MMHILKRKYEWKAIIETTELIFIRIWQREYMWNRVKYYWPIHREHHNIIHAVSIAQWDGTALYQQQIRSSIMYWLPDWGK